MCNYDVYKCRKNVSFSTKLNLKIFLKPNFTGLRPIYVIFFAFLPISFQMKNNDDMRL